MLLSHFADYKSPITLVVIYPIKCNEHLELRKAEEVYFLLYNLHIFLIFTLFVFVKLVFLVYQDLRPGRNF